MNNGYYSATGGMVTQMNRLDIVSNNLANLNTNGFKRDDVVIGDFLRIYQEKRDELPLRDQTKDAAQFLNRSIDRVPQISEEYTDKTLGAFMQTDNTLDFALNNKDYYFAIETPEGVRFTRDGSFSVSGNGTLVTKQGYPVLPREYFQNGQHITIPEGMRTSVDNDGNIYVGDPNTFTDQQVFANIATVRFKNDDYLQKEGGNLIKSLKEEDMEIVDNSGAVVQGFIEKSNVNAVNEMVALIETNRLVDMYSKVMKSHMDDLNTEAITRLAKIKG